VLALGAPETQLGDRRSSVGEEAPLVLGIDPGPYHYLRAVHRADVALVGGDDRIERIGVDEATFRKLHEADRMANDKLQEGIDGFTKAIVTLEKTLTEKL